MNNSRGGLFLFFCHGSVFCSLNTFRVKISMLGICICTFSRSGLRIWSKKSSWSGMIESRAQTLRWRESWAALADDGARHQVPSCWEGDVQMWLWNLVWLMGVDWILPPFSFTASFTHTQTELQCYSERVSCLNPRTESEKERKAERGKGGEQEE